MPMTLEQIREWKPAEGDRQLLASFVDWGVNVAVVSNLYVYLLALGRLPFTPSLARLMITSDFADWRRLDHGHHSGAIRQEFLGRWKLFDVSDEGRHAKGREDALEVGRAAVSLMQRHPDVERREAIEALIEYFEGSSAIRLDDGTKRLWTDPEYRRVRAKIDRRLRRAARELGQPPELMRLVSRM
jgi:hypothetical protein